jgi:hypothetical protein
MHDQIQFTPAESPEEISLVKQPFLEYATSLGFSLCFHGFNRELAGFPEAMLHRRATQWRRRLRGPKGRSARTCAK